MNYDIGKILDEWPFNPDEFTARRIKTRGGGEKIQIRIDMGILQLETDGRPELHVVRAEVTGPDGQPIEALARNIRCVGGQAEFEVPFALNDRAGVYTLTVRDVATGVQGTARVELSRNDSFTER